MERIWLDELLPEFDARVRRIVWAQMATVDKLGRPRMRVVHLVWRGTQGFLTTTPGSPKLQQIAANPNVSVGYWDNKQLTVTANCTAALVTDSAEIREAFSLFSSEPEPYGFDLAAIWGGSPDDQRFALVRLEAWQIELAGYPTLWNWESKVWRA